MTLRGRILDIAISVVDWWMAIWPRRRPSDEALANCRIVSHRGEHDNIGIRENTMAAFRTATDAGVWGIEGDIRWTRDLVPMVHHDPDTGRVFGTRLKISETDFADLRASLPDIPMLAELVERFGGKTHLMLELKDEIFPDLARQIEILRQLLAGLTPCRDYHFLSLDPQLFETFQIRPKNACLSVSQANAREISEATIRGRYGGTTGHYLLLDGRMQAKHALHGQEIGTGFIRSRNCLYREVNRNVAWLFTNDAVALQKFIPRRQA